jgi:hypothetical protein
MRRILAIAAMGLLVSACGDDDEATPATTTEDGSSGGDAEAYIDAVAASWNVSGEDPPLDEAQVSCVATGMVDVVGVDALTEAGIAPDEFAAADDFASLGVDLPDDATGRLSDVVADCDVVATLEAALIDAFPDELGAELPPDAVTCLTDHLDDHTVADGWAAELIDGSDERIQSLVSSATGACPAVASLVLIDQAPTELTPDAEACISAFVEGNPDLVRESFASGAAESEATQELGRRLGQACPEAVAG